MSVYCGECFGNGWNTSSSGGGTTRYANSYAIKRISNDITSDYSYDIAKMNKYAKMGEMDKALSIYNSVFEKAKTTAKDYNYSLSDGQIKSILNNANINLMNKDISDSFTETTTYPFLTGLLQSIPIVGFFTHTNSSNEILAKLDNEEVPAGTSFGEKAGRIVGGAIAVAAPFVIGGALSLPLAIGGVVAGINAIACVLQSATHSAKENA